MTTALAACGGGTPACSNDSEPFVQYELYFGRSGPGDDVVSDEAWTDFLATAVTPRFPDGLTVLDAAGQWRGADGTIARERSKLLVILVPPGDEVADSIAAVAEDYKHRFGQESVLQATVGTCVTFA